MDDCAAIKRKKARFDWFSALLVSLALILKHLFHHQLHLVHPLFHALQSLILAHGRVALPHSLSAVARPLILHLALTGISVVHAGALAVHSHALPHHSRALAHHAWTHSGLSHNLQVFLHVLHMFLPQALAFFSGRRILHLLHGLVHSIHVLLHLLNPFLVHHSCLTALPGSTLGKGSEWQRNQGGTDQRSQTVFHDFLSPL